EAGETRDPNGRPAASPKPASARPLHRDRREQTENRQDKLGSMETHLQVSRANRGNGSRIHFLALEADCLVLGGSPARPARFFGVSALLSAGACLAADFFFPFGSMAVNNCSWFWESAANELTS